MFLREVLENGPVQGSSLLINQNLYLAFVPANPPTAEEELKLVRNTLSEYLPSEIAKKALKNYAKGLVASMVANKPVQQGPVSTEPPPPKTIPPKLPSPTGKNIDNPALLDPKSSYYGPINTYKDLTKTQQQLLLLINAALERNKMEEISMVWGGRYGGVNINFIAYGANGKFMWRKYDTGGGSGQNWVFIGKMKMNTSSFASAPAATQDGWLATIK